MLPLLVLWSVLTAVQAAAQPVPATRPPGQLFENVTESSFDFWLLALSWPPALVPPAAQSRARHAVVRQEAHAGFWTHGL